MNCSFYWDSLKFFFIMVWYYCDICNVINFLVFFIFFDEIEEYVYV